MNNHEKAEIIKKASHFLKKRKLNELSLILDSIGENPKSEYQNEELLKMFETAKNVEGCSARSLKYYMYILNAFFSTTSVNACELTTEHIREYLDKYMLKTTVSNASVDNIRRVLSSFFSWLEEENHISKSPMKRIHKIKAMKPVKTAFSDENIETLKDISKTKRDKAIIELLISTGMRVGELVNLDIENIDFENKECIVLGKGNKERRAYFDSKTKIHLKEYLKQRKDRNEALFVSLQSPFQRLQISGVEIMLRKLGKKVNIDKVHPHRFRRTLATKAIDKGMPVEQVQILLGHTKIDTTMHYALVDQSNVKNSYRRFIG